MLYVLQVNLKKIAKIIKFRSNYAYKITCSPHYIHNFLLIIVNKKNCVTVPSTDFLGSVLVM